MKKKTLFLAIFLVMLLFIMCTSVNAADTLQSKIDSAENGATIVLDQDYTEDIVIASDKTITIDLNGHTIKNVSGNTITNNGKLTITGEGTVDNVTHGKSALLDNGKFERTLEKGTFEPDQSNGNSYYTIKNWGTLTIEDGVEVYNNGGYSSAIENGFQNSATENPNKVTATLTINGGTFEGGKNTIKNDEYGVLNIKNGTFKNEVQCVLLNWNVATIDGGMFEGGVDGVVNAMYKDTAGIVGDLTINGGTFIASETGEAVREHGSASYKAPFKVTGGTYSSDVKDYVADGLVSKLLNGKYVVGKENTITVLTGTTEGGRIYTTPEKALAGETVSISTIITEGYELKGITVKDSSENVIEVTNYKFVMPDSAVTVEATFAKLTQETEVPVIDPTEEVKEVTVGVADKDKVDSVLLETLNSNEEFAEVLKTSNLKVSLEVNDIVLTEEEQKEIDEILAESGVKVEIAKFFDIEVLVKDSNTQAELGKLSELNKEIEFTIALPENLKAVEEGYTRVFYLVREHNGEFDALEATLSADGKFLTFASDKFSVYALAYVDVENESGDNQTGNNGENENNNQTEEKDDTPKTGDIVLEVSAALAVISVAGIIVFARNNKKNKK